MAGQHILVVDDHNDSANLLTRLLRRHGHTVAAARSASGAVALAAGSPQVDLLVTDLNLADGDGCDLLTAIRAIHPGLRAVAVTGSERPEDRRRCERAGFDGFLLKPVGLDDLVAAVRRVRPAA